jgi:hypothetical protein
MARLGEPLRKVCKKEKSMPTAMRGAILMLLLAVVSRSAMADWVKVGSNQTDTLYVDPSTIRAGADNSVKLWAMNDFKVPQRLHEREPFKSEKAEYEYDCKLAQSRLLYFTSYTESMAEGEVVDFNLVPGAWDRVPPNSGLEELWKIACGKG